LSIFYRLKELGKIDKAEARELEKDIIEETRRNIERKNKNKNTGGDYNNNMKDSNGSLFNNFRQIEQNFWRDTDNLFFRCYKVPDINPDDLTIVPSPNDDCEASYIHDGRNVYYVGIRADNPFGIIEEFVVKKLENVTDVNHFVMSYDCDKSYDAIGKNFSYKKGKIVDKIPETDISVSAIRIGESNYYKDENTIYYNYQNINVGDFKTFEVISDTAGYAKDTSCLYHNGKIMIDPNTSKCYPPFEPNFIKYEWSDEKILDSNYLINGSSVFYGDKKVENIDTNSIHGLREHLLIDKIMYIAKKKVLHWNT